MTDEPAAPDLLTLAGRLHRTMEPIHVVAYFAPEVLGGWESLGMHPQLGYFAGRSAAMGAVGPGVTAATFYVFKPSIVEMAIPGYWELAAPEQVLATRHATMTAALERVLGRSDDLEEAESLARRATAGLSPEGRPLYAAHAALEWPADPLLGLWHAQTLLREHRGDGHVAALLGHQLDPVEAMVTYGQISGTTGFLKKTRGWSDAEWSAAADRLRDRGLLDADGGLTDAGQELRRSVEEQTQRSAMAGWEHLGLEGARRLLELARPLRDTLAGAGLFPTSLVPPPRG